MTDRIRQAVLILAASTGEQVVRARQLPGSTPASVMLHLQHGKVAYVTPDDRVYRSPVADPAFRSQGLTPPPPDA